MTRVPMGSYSRTYFSIEVIKTPQRHPNIRKPFYILTIPKVKLNLALKMIRTPKRFSKLSIMVRSKMPSSIKNCNMYKPVHRLAKQVSVLVFTWRGSLLKDTSGQTLLSSLLPHYHADFNADLVLAFGVLIGQVVFVTISTFAYNFSTFV